jgi:hypothetical protein
VHLPLISNQLYRANFLKRLINSKFPEIITKSQNIEQPIIKMMTKINPSLNFIRTNELLKHTSKYLLKSLPCFNVLDQNLKQLETLTPIISQVIETSFKENNQLLKKVITCNKSSKSKYFKIIMNKISFNLHVEPKNKTSI